MTNDHLFFTLKYIFNVKECSKKIIVEAVRNTVRTETLQLFQVSSKRDSFSYTRASQTAVTASIQILNILVI